MASENTTSEPERIPTIDPEVEPEYVGAHSGRVNVQCQEYHGETRDEIERCGNFSTHTIVMESESGVHEIAVCDDCGEPEDVDADDRVWSGVVEEE